jgi:hypothetical protein
MSNVNNQLLPNPGQQLRIAINKDDFVVVQIVIKTGAELQRMTETGTYTGMSGPSQEKKKDRKKGMPLDEANLAAREALKGTPSGGGEWTVRTLATAIGCATGQISSLPAWQLYQKARQSKAGKPSVRWAIASLDQAVAVKADHRANDPSELVAAAELAELAGGDEAKFRELIAEQGKDMRSRHVESERPLNPVSAQ